MAKFTEKVSQMRAQWDRLSTRERRLVSTLAGVFGLFLTLLLGYFVWSGLADIQDHNEAARQALKDIAQHRDEFLEARRRMTSQEVRVSRTPIQLSSILESAATEAGLKIDETNDRPQAPRGKKYIEKGLDLKIRKTDLQSLTKFLRRIESGPNLILFDHINVRTRYNEHDALEVELGVMTFEHAPETPKGKGDKT
jgi:type II secretion system (T2SS) protein M